jgi:hypothetical protein
MCGGFPEPVSSISRISSIPESPKRPALSTTALSLLASWSEITWQFSTPVTLLWIDVVVFVCVAAASSGLG